MRDPLIYVVSPYEDPLVEGTFHDGPRIRLLQIAQTLAVNGCNVVFLSRGPSVPPRTVGRISLESWQNFKDLRRSLAKAQVVIASYAALGLNKLILSIISRNQILIADAIVPIMAEEDSRKIKQNIDTQILAHFLTRSQLTIFSSNSLKKFYNSFINNTIKVRKEFGNYFVFPFMHFNIDNALPKIDNSPTLRLIFYGGVYPWFGVEELENFLKKFPHSNSQIQLTIAGLVNPNLRDQEIGNITKRIISTGLNNKNIVFKPWIPPSQRLDFLGKFDAAVFF